MTETKAPASGTSVKEQLSRLSPRADSCVKSKRLRGKATFRELRDLISELARFDKATDEVRSKTQMKAGVGCVVMIVAIIAAVVAIAMEDEIGMKTSETILYAMGGLAVLSLIFAVVFQVKAGRLGKLDLANDFRLCLKPLLDDLAEDVSNKTRVDFDVDMKGVCKEKMIERGEIPPGRFKKVIQTKYRDPWCALRMRLADGSVMDLDIVDHYTLHERRWTNPRGKSKSKFKWKKLVVVSATLVPGGKGLDFSREDAKIAEGMGKLKIKDKKDAKVLRLVKKYKFKSIMVEPKETAAHDDVLGMYMKLYSMMKPAQDAE